MRAKCPITAFAAAMTLAAAAPVCAEETEPAAAPEAAEAGPSLVLAISVDQFSADLFAQYRRNFTDGLARLQQGAVFPSGYQAHAADSSGRGILRGKLPLDRVPAVFGRRPSCVCGPCEPVIAGVTE